MSKKNKPKKLSNADWGWDDAKPAPWFIASFASTLACCGEECEEGDEIRADGTGGYEGRCCYAEDG